MRRRVLTPHPGLSTGIGYYLAGMEEVRRQVQVVVKAIPDDLIGKPAFRGAHSIGGLVLHLPVYIVYLMVMGEEMVKYGIGLWRVGSKRWINNLVQAT